MYSCAEVSLEPHSCHRLGETHLHTDRRHQHPQEAQRQVDTSNRLALQSADSSHWWEKTSTWQVRKVPGNQRSMAEKITAL